MFLPIHIARNQRNPSQHVGHRTNVRGWYLAWSIFTQHWNFFLMHNTFWRQLNWIKCVNKSRESFQCDVTLALCPRGHMRQVKKSCGQANQTLPSPVMSKSVAGLNNAGDWSLNEKSTIKHTHSCFIQYVSIYFFSKPFQMNMHIEYNAVGDILYSI